MKIEQNRVVNLAYRLFVDGENGQPELMEEATAQHPINFIFGLGMMLPKFENNLVGLQAGDTFDFVLNETEAYGAYDDKGVVELERAVFEINGQIDEKIVFEGNVVPLMDSEGNRLQAQVVTVGDTHITIDLNHPLAGETLHFKGEVIEVREATEEDLQALQGGGCCGGGCHCDEGGCDDGGCDPHSQGGCGCGC